MSEKNKNADLEWMYGKIEIDKSEMNKLIENYLNHFIEPSYQHLYYDNDPKGRIWYNYNITMQCIQNKGDELNEQTWRLNNFQYLIIKNSFPDKFKDYLFQLLTQENQKYYNIMNKECKYRHGQIMEPYWTKSTAAMQPEYCILTIHGPVMCQNCKYYLDVIKEHIEIINT
jgi:hypothetical protein